MEFQHFQFCLTLEPKIGDVTASIKPQHFEAHVSLDNNYFGEKNWMSSTYKSRGGAGLQKCPEMAQWLLRVLIDQNLC